MSAPFDPTSLNPEQLRAVNHPHGPLLVFAGAGSGKTRVITCRIAKLLSEGTPAHRIVAVTFTNKAAKEMLERIQQMSGALSRSLWMGTFHSICARILRIDGANIGIDPRFVVYDDGDQISLMKEVLRELQLDEKQAQPRMLLNEISRAKEKLLTPQEYEQSISSYQERLVAHVYPKYSELLRANRALDFDDLIFYAVKLLEEVDHVREAYQERFLHVLVDEYQDVNLSQYRLAKIISSKHRNITIVGDDDQSIYSWRGADVTLMHRFTNDYKDATVIKLVQNYRSTQNILSAAHSVIKHNRSRVDKQLWTENESGSPITITEVGTEQDEAVLIADTILKDTRSNRRSFKDFAILYRTNAQSRAFEEVFITMRIPHVLIGGTRFYERKEIKDMIAYLRLVLNPEDTISLRRIINVPARGIGPGALGAAEAFAREFRLTLWEAIRNPEMHSRLPAKSKSGLRRFVAIIEEARDMMKDRDVTPLLRFVMTQSGYIDSLKMENTEEAHDRLENLQELLTATTRYDTEVTDGSLSGYLENVALMSDTDNLEDQSNTVTLMTLHSSKGLEFPTVFLAGLEEGVFPHARSLESDHETEEERRLCYVGITRAREELHLIYAQRRTIFGRPSFGIPSRFLDDIPREITDTLMQQSIFSDDNHRVRRMRDQSYAVIESKLSPSRAPEWKPPFTVGQSVKHGKFGIGIVIACSPLRNDAEVTVSFPGEAGVKKLVQSLAKLEAIV